MSVQAVVDLQTETVDYEEDEEVETMAEASQRRIRSLVGITMSLLFSCKTSYTVNDFKDKMFSITYYEARTCTNIINNILLYVPDKKQMNTIGYQLPMISLASDILALTAYAGKLCQIS